MNRHLRRCVLYTAFEEQKASVKEQGRAAPVPLAPWSAREGRADIVEMVFV